MIKIEFLKREWRITFFNIYIVNKEEIKSNETSTAKGGGGWLRKGKNLKINHPAIPASLHPFNSYSL
jgi:hypothetical protein